MNQTESKIQADYYTKTAAKCDGMHLEKYDEHYFALSVMVGMLNYLNVKSILDIGSGTGRAIQYIKALRPDIRIVGIEPIAELREIAYQKGIAKEELIAGNALNLAFSDGEFDLVCEFGVLHHIKTPDIAVNEMLRVANKAIFISDSNNFGQGSFFSRIIKQAVNAVGLWKLADFIKTKGKGYTISEGDGLAYSYSVFNNYEKIKTTCKSIHFMNTLPSGFNLYHSASHVCLLGIK